MRKLVVELQLRAKEAVERAKRELENLNKVRIEIGERIKQSLAGLKDSVVSFATSIQGVIVGILGGAIVKTVAGIIDKYDAAIKKLSALEGDRAREILNSLSKTAFETNMELSALVDTFTTLRSILPAEQALALTQQIYRIADAYGLSTQEAERFGNTIAKAFAFGDVGARELYSILANAPQFLNTFATQLGISTQEFIQNLQDGKYTVQELYNILANAPLPQSISATTEGIAGLRTLIEGLIYDIIQSTGALDKIKSIIQAIRDIVSRFTPEIKLIFDILNAIGNIALNAWLYTFQDVWKILTAIGNFVIGLGERFSWIGKIVETLRDAFLKLLQIIALGLTKILELISKIPIVGGSARAILDSIKNIQEAIAKYKEIKLQASIEPKPPASLPPVKMKGAIEVEQVEMKTPPKREAIREKPQFIIPELLPVEIKPIPSTPEIADIATLFTYELQNRLSTAGEQLGKALAEGIKTGTYTNLSQDLSNILLDSIFATLSIIEPQLAPIFGILSGLLKGLLEPSPELKNIVEKTTNIEQTINIYIERADISDKGFWETLVRDKIQPAAERLKPTKRGWGL